MLSTFMMVLQMQPQTPEVDPDNAEFVVFLRGRNVSYLTVANLPSLAKMSGDP